MDRHIRVGVFDEVDDDVLHSQPADLPMADAVIITVISWWSGSAHGAAVYEANVTITVAVLAMALIKTRFVIRHYMEVRFVPFWLQLTCDAWFAALFGLIAYFYWF